MRIIGFGTRPALKVETKSATPQKQQIDTLVKSATLHNHGSETSQSATPQKQSEASKSTTPQKPVERLRSETPRKRMEIAKEIPSQPKQQQQPEQRGPINTTTAGSPLKKIKAPKSPERIRASGNSSGFMKSTAASENRDISIPTRTISEDASTTSTEREIALEKLKASLVRFVRSGNRRMLMKSLKESRALKSIPIDDIETNIIYPATAEEMTILEKEKLGLPVALNGMLLGADGRPSKFTHLMRLLCNRLARSEIQMSSDELYESVLVRLVTESSEKTAEQALQSALETNELSVRVIERNDSTKPKPTQPRPPSKLTLYAADGAAHCFVEQLHTVGLYRKSDAGRPWAAFTAVVRERINLSTGRGVKHVTVQVPDVDKLYG